MGSPDLFGSFGVLFLHGCKSSSMNVNEDVYPWPDPSNDDGGLMPSSVIKIGRIFCTETNE